MKNISKSNVVTAIICAVFISIVSFCSGAVAASENAVSYKSQGKIIFNNNTEDTADDVIFDASDFKTINDMVVSGKKLVGTELNKYPSVNIDLTRNVPDFSELASAIDTLTDDATADGSMLLNNATAYVKGAKIKGTIPSKGEAAYTPGRADQTIASGQYLSGVQTIKGDANLSAGNIVEGKTIFGVSGTATAESHIIESSKSVSISDTSGTITPSNGNNAMEQVTYSVSGVDADKIVSGQSILGVSGTVTKESHTALSVNDITEAAGTATKVLEAGKTYKIPSGKYADGDMYLSAEGSQYSYDCSYIRNVTLVRSDEDSKESLCVLGFLEDIGIPNGTDIGVQYNKFFYGSGFADKSSNSCDYSYSAGAVHVKWSNGVVANSRIRIDLCTKYTTKISNLDNITTGSATERCYPYVFDLSSQYADYKNLTINDMLVEITAISGGSGATDKLFTLNYAYNSDNGQITITTDTGNIMSRTPVKINVYIL